MIKLNRIGLTMIILVTAGLLISAGYILLEDNKNQTDNKNPVKMSENNNTTNNTTKKDSLMSANITQKTKPVFDIGNTFVYEFPHIPPQNLIIGREIFFNNSITCILEYNVIDTIKIDNTSYFKVQENSPKCIIGLWGLNGVLKPMFRGGYNIILYVNEDTGEIFTETETMEKEKISTCYWSGCWYAFWMLKLDDGVKWQEETLYSENERVVYEFSVEGREILDGRECFEVKIKENECLKGSCKMVSRELYYIDVEKRVTLRYYLWYEDLPVRETRLIDQNYFNKTISSTWDEIKTNISEYEKRMRLVNRVGYCEDNFCNPENNETMESCCMDCGCSEGKVCNGVCLLDNWSTLKFSSEMYGFNITLPSGWRGKWRGDSIFFELASEPWTSVEVFFDSLTEKTPQYAYYTSDNLTAGNRNFTVIYSAPAQEDYENNLGLYERIKSSFRGI